jgi:hypothetical protein
MSESVLEVALTQLQQLEAELDAAPLLGTHAQ